MELKDGQLFFEEPIISREDYRKKSIQVQAAVAILKRFQYKIWCEVQDTVESLNRIQQRADICEEFQCFYDFGTEPVHSFEEYKEAAELLKQFDFRDCFGTPWR